MQNTAFRDKTKRQYQMFQRESEHIVEFGRLHLFHYNPFRTTGTGMPIFYLTAYIIDLPHITTQPKARMTSCGNALVEPFRCTSKCIFLDDAICIIWLVYLNLMCFNLRHVVTYIIHLTRFISISSAVLSNTFSKALRAQDIM